MPVCPECSFWTPDFSMGDVDHNGTYVLPFLMLFYVFHRWFCNGCWQAWEEQRREQRLTTGKLLPEDRVVWYSNTTSPFELDDLDSSESMKLQLYEQFCSDSGWLKVDTYGLTIETFFSETESGVYLHTSEEKSKVCEFGESTLYKSLCYRPFQESEFVFDFDFPELELGPLDICSLDSLPFVYFSSRLLGERFVEYRERARGVRREIFLEKQERMRKEKEAQEQKRKQMIEIQQKQKDLLQIALKRAQNKKVQLQASPPTPPFNVWSSATARPSPPPLIMPPAQGTATWSSRPIIPPSMPQSWPVPASAFMPQPVVDPWSSAAVSISSWSSVPPAAKKPKPEPQEPPPSADGDIQRQRMARLGVPFK